MESRVQRRRSSTAPFNGGATSSYLPAHANDKPPPSSSSSVPSLMPFRSGASPSRRRSHLLSPLARCAPLLVPLLVLLAFAAGFVLRDFLEKNNKIILPFRPGQNTLLTVHDEGPSTDHADHHHPSHPSHPSPVQPRLRPAGAIIGDVGNAGVSYYHPAAVPHQVQDPNTPQPHHAPGPDPVWWLADEHDDFYEREYLSRETLWAVRDINRKIFFTGLCGLYRFNLSAMPDISVIVTVQNEHDRMLSLTIHTVLARTPPSILREIIIVDDNGVGEQERAGVNETEFAELKTLPKVTIIHNDVREGCARSRLAGARIASGEVLVFIDSHVEMMSATWAEHLLAPIVENPRTMALQTLDIISDLDHSYGDGSGDLLYGVITNQFFFGYQRSRFSGQEEEKPGRRVPYETPFGPGSLFAIRRDEFWRLGGYDKGLFVWGGENTELALKMWMCGGRMVMVPCSRVGHMYRVHMKETGRWPPYLPQDLTDRLGCGHEGEFLNSGNPADNFTKIITRNNIRIMETWVGDHPAKHGYYKSILGGETLPPEWQQYVDELKTDANAQEQREIRQRNQCHDFEWFDRHVFKKLTGVHHPWHPSIVEKTWI